MRIFNSAQISPSERQDILNKHKSLYDGYRSVYPQVSNEQPLYVYDPAQDKLGATITTKGEVKPYTDYRINESEEKDMCSECGGMMYEGECSECGWKMEETKEGYKTGKLSDIYNVEDLGDAEFDYVEGGGNDYGTFEKMHHMKEETATSNAPVSLGKHYSEIKDPYNFFSDGHVGDGKTLRQSNIDEQGFTGGGNAPDFDLDAEPAYDFKSKGPEEGDGPFDIKANDMDLDDQEEWQAFDFESGGPDNGGEVYPVFEDEFDDLIDMDNELEDEREELEETDYEEMISAFIDDEEITEQDISGVQGMYGEMEPAYDFDSGGPGIAGPYQHSQWGGRTTHSPKRKFTESEIETDSDEFMGVNDTAEDDVYWEKDLEHGELDLDLSKFNPEDASWEEIKAHTGNWEEIDEEIQESFVKQQQKILEMFNRFNAVK